MTMKRLILELGDALSPHLDDTCGKSTRVGGRAQAGECYGVRRKELGVSRGWGAAARWQLSSVFPRLSEPPVRQAEIMAAGTVSFTGSIHWKGCRVTLHSTRKV